MFFMLCLGPLMITLGSHPEIPLEKMRYRIVKNIIIGAVKISCKLACLEDELTLVVMSVLGLSSKLKSPGRDGV